MARRQGVGTFKATDPNINQLIDREYPISNWDDIDEVLSAAAQAAEQLRRVHRESIAKFLERFADKIEAAKAQLVDTAFEETGLAKSPRLADVELPRTTNQLRLAAAAARTGDWARPTIDTKAGIRSVLESIGPVCVFWP